MQTNISDKPKNDTALRLPAFRAVLPSTNLFPNKVFDLHLIRPSYNRSVLGSIVGEKKIAFAGYRRIQ